ncbi:Phenol hydroxylase-like protein [Cladobotryum mycophilum]|uniref:Phenol hydroxylase-like protein n=1 Tax=Cladobotryum mycophilum TaxID=491253 RepID=A0ABR0SJK2_9HYPO
MVSVDFTDVLIVGAGPIGLVTALGLAQQGIDTLLIEKRDAKKHETFGRAASIHPRTLELLEQVDITDELLQAGAIHHSYSSYRNGKPIFLKGMQSVFLGYKASFHSYALSVRQAITQTIVASKYKTDFNKSVHHEWELVDLKVDTEIQDDYNVTATISHVSLGERTIRCKYIVGADGTQSTVRQLAGIDMVGDETSYKWVRLDGKFKTDIPGIEDGGATVESDGHPHLFIFRLDGDSYRIGYTLTQQQLDKYPEGPTQEQCMFEAIEAIKPFKLEFERLDWWTIYRIKQKVAAFFQKDEYVLLAGDSCHTHSSGMAQGMNTGIHDATNLIWKLSGQLKGWYKSDVLATYDPERRKIAQKVIDIDRLMATCMSGDLPEAYKSLGMNRYEVMNQVAQANASFNSGIGVSYEETTSVVLSEARAGTWSIGLRCADELVKHPGPSVPVRLQSIIHKSKGRWNVLVFASNPLKTRDRFKALRVKMTAQGSSFIKRAHMMRVYTLIIGSVSSVWDAFEGPALGRLYFDPEGLAHAGYGIPHDGTIIVIRPDGIVAFAAGLHQLDEVEEFFDGFCA